MSVCAAGASSVLCEMGRGEGERQQFTEAGFFIRPVWFGQVYSPIWSKLERETEVTFKTPASFLLWFVKGTSGGSLTVGKPRFCLIICWNQHILHHFVPHRKLCISKDKCIAFEVYKCISLALSDIFRTEQLHTKTCINGATKGKMLL